MLLCTFSESCATDLHIYDINLTPVQKNISKHSITSHIVQHFIEDPDVDREREEKCLLAGCLVTVAVCKCLCILYQCACAHTLLVDVVNVKSNKADA